MDTYLTVNTTVLVDRDEDGELVETTTHEVGGIVTGEEAETLIARIRAGDKRVAGVKIYAVKLTKAGAPSVTKTPAAG